MIIEYFLGYYRTQSMAGLLFWHFDRTGNREAGSKQIKHKQEKGSKHKQFMFGSFVTYQCEEAIVSGKGEMSEP